MNLNQIVQRGGGIVRGGVSIAARVGQQVTGTAFGWLQRGIPSRRMPKPDMDDVTLARKVETEIFRGADAPKSSVNVNVVDGVVWLRGDVKHPDQIRSLEAQVQAIPEVHGVENLLHLPKTPAPTRADTPARQQRTRSSTRRPTPRRRTQGRITDDRTDALSPEAEPSPSAHARKRQGRTPAPVGSRGDSGTRGESKAVPPQRRLPAPDPEGPTT
jgi:BON domain